MARQAIYGNVTILRGYCRECSSYAFILEGKYVCCDKSAQELERGRKRMSDCPLKRAALPRWQQERILSIQQHRCFYCAHLFGAHVYRHSRELVLRITWDHINPYTYSLDNREQNYVAACHVCNGLKSALVFGGVDEARSYLSERWKEKGYGDVPPVQIVLSAETRASGVLQPEVPSEGLA